MTSQHRPCGNDPRAELTDGDNQAVEEVRAYLAERKATQVPSIDELHTLVDATEQHPLGPVEAQHLRRAVHALAGFQRRNGKLRTERDELVAEVDRLTTEIAEGIANQTMLKGLNVVDGQVLLEVEPAREMLLVLVASMRAMLDEAGAENYLTTEATFPPAVHLDLQDGQHPEDSYTLTVQRRHRPTAHDLRCRAEAERNAALGEVDRLRAERDAALLQAAVTVLEVPRPDPLPPLQLRLSAGHADLWAICDRTGRRWGRDGRWCYEPEREELCDDSRWPLAEALPLAQQLAAAPTATT